MNFWGWAAFGDEIIKERMKMIIIAFKEIEFVCAIVMEDIPSWQQYIWRVKNWETIIHC